MVLGFESLFKVFAFTVVLFEDLKHIEEVSWKLIVSGFMYFGVGLKVSAELLLTCIWRIKKRSFEL